MAALAAYIGEPESWDDDPDLDFSSGPLLRPLNIEPALTLQPPSDSEPTSPVEEPDSALDSLFERAAGEWEDAPHMREEDNESSMDSSRTHTTTGTLKGLMDCLSLNAGASTATSLQAVDGCCHPRSVPIAKHDTTSRPSETTDVRGSLMPTTRLATSHSTGTLSEAPHLGSTPPDQAIAVEDWDSKLDDLDDFESSGPGLLHDPVSAMVKSGSSANELGLKNEGDGGVGAFEAPQESEKSGARKRSSLASLRDAEDNADSEDGFELPSALTHFNLALAITTRPSSASLRSITSETLSVRPHTPTAQGLAAPANEHTSYTGASSAPSSPGPLTPSRLSEDDGPSSSALDDDDDEFFEDLVLPSYFLKGDVKTSERNHVATPPTSDGEPDSDAAGAPKVDLQSILRAKLEARGRRGLLFHPSMGTQMIAALPLGSPQEEARLARHREREEEGDGAELARDLRRSSLSEASTTDVEAKDDGWSAGAMRERMRAISGARAKEAQQAREAREAGRIASRLGIQRRTASDGQGLPGPDRRLVPSMPTMASTGGPLKKRSSLPTSSTSGIRTGAPQAVRPPSTPGAARPSSVASSHSNEGGGTTRRRGPPPAPSATSRGPERKRTTSLQSGPSRFILEGASRRRPVELDLTVAQSRRSISPGPLTPATPSSASRPSLRPKRSQQHLSAAAAASAKSSRTLNRKRSLQNLPALASPTPGAPVPAPASSTGPRSRRNSLRSPSPAGPLPSFAAPTASSASRVRDRVHSSPAPLVPATSASASVHSIAVSAWDRPRATPSVQSAISERLLRPTLASASKARTAPRSCLPNKPFVSPAPRLPSTATSAPLSSLRLPSASITLSRPLRGLRSAPKASYGDGTELDGFDDLPVSKEHERERVIRPASSRKSSDTSTATIRAGGSWGRKDGSRLVDRVNAIVISGKAEGVRGLKEGAATTRDMEQMKKERNKVSKASDPDKKKIKRQREPHLIRHLGAAGAIKVQGEMTWNPTLQRWEGNEAVLRDFERSLTTSTRPALISPFSAVLGSPQRGPSVPVRGSAQSSTTSTATTLAAFSLPAGAAPSASRATAKVVGDMVFDPAACSWHAINGPDAEDILELDWGGGTSGGEAADDEAATAGGFGAVSDLDGWDLGERERLLQDHENFALEEGSDEDAPHLQAGVDSGVCHGGARRTHTTKRQIWRESQAAQERSRVELALWQTDEPDEAYGRKWLWDLRALVLGTQ